MDNKQIIDTLLEALRMARDYPELELKLAAVCKENIDFKQKMEKLQRKVANLKKQMEADDVDV